MQLTEEDCRSMFFIFDLSSDGSNFYIIGIEEIKRKYAKDKPTTQKVSELYDDYKKQVVDPKKSKDQEFSDSSSDKNGDLRESNSQEKPGDKHEGKDAGSKKVIKKLKTKSKGDKENVLKTIKLKLK